MHRLLPVPGSPARNTIRGRSASSASAAYSGEPTAATTPEAGAGVLAGVLMAAARAAARSESGSRRLDPSAARLRADAIEQRRRGRGERGHGLRDALVARLGGSALPPAVVELLHHDRRLPLAERLVPGDRRHVEAGALRVARDHV